MAAKKKAPQQAVNHIPSVWTNANRNTCISYAETESFISIILMDTPELRAESLRTEQFRADWSLIEGYDAAVAAQKYLESLIQRSSEVQTTLEKIAMSDTNTATPSTKATAAPKAAVTAAKKIAAKVTPAPKKAPKKAPVAAAPAAKKSGNKATTPAAAKKEAKAASGRKPKVDYSAMKIKLCKGSESKRFQEGSVRARCFALIKDGMMVPEYLKAVAKAKICEEPMAIDCLKKLSEPSQKQQTIELK